MARIIGPGAAGLLIAAFGLAVPFLVNGVSFLAITVALLLMRQSEFVPKAPVKREKGQVARHKSRVGRPKTSNTDADDCRHRDARPMKTRFRFRSLRNTPLIGKQLVSIFFRQLWRGRLRL